MSQNNISIEELGSVEAYSEQEKPVRLAELWSEGIAVVVFVRHFG